MSVIVCSAANAVIVLQQMLFEKWLSLVKLSGIYEHYNPLTGEAYGAAGLGMSTLVCDLIYKYGRI